jgi:hypothetical protein
LYFAIGYQAGSLVLYFDPEDGRNIFLRNTGSVSTDYTALYSRGQDMFTISKYLKQIKIILYSDKNNFTASVV